MGEVCCRCKNWVRCHDDFYIGLCLKVQHYRFQYEDCRMFELADGCSTLDDDWEKMSLTKLRNESILSLYREGVDTKRIAYEFGLDPHYIRRLLKGMV